MLQWATGRSYLNLWCRVTAKVCVDLWLADWLAYWWWICWQIFMWHFVHSAYVDDMTHEYMTQCICWSCISTINVTSVVFGCIEFCSDNIQRGQSELVWAEETLWLEVDGETQPRRKKQKMVSTHKCCRLDWGVWAAWRNNAEALEKQLENFKTKVLLVSSCFRSMQ